MFGIKMNLHEKNRRLRKCEKNDNLKIEKGTVFPGKAADHGGQRRMYGV